MSRVRALVAGVVLVAACSSDTWVSPEVPLPDDATPVATVEDDVGSWSILERPNHCLLLEVTIGERRWLSDERCRDPLLGMMLATAERGIRFNDEDREYQKCSDDCSGPTPDAEMSAPVLWGAVGDQTGFVCFAIDGVPTVVRPDDAGFVLAPTPGVDLLRGFPDDILAFLPDGRYIGTDPPEHPELIEQCQALGAPGATPPRPLEWPFTIKVPPSLRSSELGLFITTDTGWAPVGATLHLLAGGHQIPLRLHADTTTLTVGQEVGSRGLESQELRLPALVMEILDGSTTCGSLPGLVLQLDDEGQARLELAAEAGC